MAKTLGIERADLLVRAAAVGVVAWDIGLTAKIVLGAWDLTPVNRLAVLGSAAYLPLSVILVVRGIRNNGSRSSRRILAILALVVFCALPFAGPEWPPILALVAGFGLIFIKPRRALPLFAACVVAADAEAVVWTARSPGTAPVHGYGAEFASFDTVDIVWTGVALAILIVLARTLGELQAARRQLAAQALVVERQRIDGELARTIGAALELIIASGDTAAGLVRDDPQAAARELRDLTARSRTTLADARSVLSRYRSASLEAELGAVTTLLAAAGIRAATVLPEGELPAQLPESLRRRLRAAVTSALTAGAVTECRIVISRDRAGELDLEITGGLRAAGRVVA